MRKCRLCKVVKPLDDFYAHPHMREGHDSKCKECAKAIVHAAKDRRPEYYREFDRQRSTLPKRKESCSRVCAAYDKKYPDRKFATQCINNALRSGKIFKPLNCAICNQEKNRIHGHHNDYSKPFEVTWMCAICHKDWHKHNEPKRIEGF